MSLSREEILNAKDNVMEEFPVPEWGGSVFIRSIGATSKERIGQRMVGPDGKSRNMIGFRAAICAEGIVDEKGIRIFSQEDVELIGDKSDAVLDRLSTAIRRLSKMDREDVEAEVGNSVDGQSVDSTSA